MVTSNDISIILPYANRRKNLIRCLGYLKKQTVCPKEIVISDYSAGDYKKVGLEVATLFKELPLKFVHNSKDIFVRGPSINFGRRFITTPLIFILDVDISFDTNGVEIILNEFGPPPFKKFLLAFKGYNRNSDGKFTPRVHSHKQVYGGFQTSRVEDFDCVGGYNPFMTGWGAEDVDYRLRLLSIGVGQKVIDKNYVHWEHKKSVITPNRSQQNLTIAKRSKWDGKRWKLYGKGSISYKTRP